jgi:hypothetical protein
MKKLVLLLSASLFALATTVFADSMTAEGMIVEAEQAIEAADEIGFLWRDTEGFLAEAKKLLADGKEAEAFDLAQKAYEQAVLAKEQGEYMKANWQSFIPL